VYEPLFAPLRDKHIRLVELGLLYPKNQTSSLEIWRAFFPKAMVMGMDIQPVYGAIQGDAGKREDLMKLGTGFDIVIDDASHDSQDQQIALGFLAKHMNPGGIYCIEDLHWQPEGSTIPKTHTVLDIYRTTGHNISPHMTTHEKLCLEGRISSIQFFDSLHPKMVLEQNEALAVLRFR
jgi:hypothetical protein